MEINSNGNRYCPYNALPKFATVPTSVRVEFAANDLIQKWNSMKFEFPYLEANKKIIQCLVVLSSFF